MTQPQRTPGDDREDAAIAAGAAVAVIMAALSGGLIGLLVPALRRVLTGIPSASMARRVHAEGTAMVDEAVRQVKVALAQRGQGIVELTEKNLNLPPKPPGVSFGSDRAPLALPVGSFPATVDPSMPALAESIRQAGLNALRDTDDVFRRAAEAATANHSTGTQAAQRMLDELVDHGLTGYVDSSGRTWTLSTYAEMATRTAASRLAMSTQLQLMGPRGFDLVVIDAPSGEIGCRKCAPFEGRVLSLTGRTPVGQLVSVHDAYGRRKAANVTASLASAVADGLFHPNCRHFPLPFIDGAGSLPVVGAPRGFVRHGNPIYRVVIPPKDSRAYEIQQEQRALERAVRSAITRKQLALSPQAKARANGQVLAARRELAQHVTDFHQTRQRYREDPTKAR